MSHENTSIISSAAIVMPLAFLADCLQRLSSSIGLSPPLTILVLLLTLTGAVVNWNFNHHDHSDDDGDKAE